MNTNETDRRRAGLRALTLAMLCIPLSAPAAEPKPYVRDELEEVSATIESVNRDDRTVVIRADDGTREKFALGPEVRNFAQINAGDRVVVNYYEGLAAEVKPKGAALREMDSEVNTARAAPGARPAAGVGATVSATVQIESVDTSVNTVRFKRSDGITRTVAIADPDAVKFIRTLKPGDVVQIRYTEAIAVSVEPALKPASAGEPERR